MTSINLRIDQPLVPIDQPCTRHLIVELTAPRGERGPQTVNRPPLDLALALDASVSMRGERLEAARRAALEVASRLEDTDHLTLVSFQSNVHVHLDARPMTPTGRAVAENAICSIEAGGMTNLSGGWRTAGQLLLQAEPGTASRKHCILLSDGRANRGETSPEALAHQARNLLDAGVTTTAVGIGDGYSSRQLAVIAEQGGGRLHEAELGAEIGEVLCGELVELADLAAERMQLELVLPAGVTAEELSGAPCEQLGQRLRCTLGSLRAGDVRRVVLRLALPAGVGLPQLFGITVGAELTWHDPDGGQAGSCSASVELQPSAHPAPAPCVEDARIVLTAWRLGLTRRVTQLNEEHHYLQVTSLEESELPAFKQYAGFHRETAGMLEGLLRVLAGAAQPMLARSRKQLHMAAYKQSKGERDVRGGHPSPFGGEGL